MKNISVVITESDRRKAERYSENCGCLLFTALKREGFPVDNVGGTTVKIENHVYQIPDWFRPEKTPFVKENAFEKPFYKQFIVGRKITLRRLP